MLSATDLPPECASHRVPEAHFTVRVGSSVHEVERELIVRTVAHAGGNNARAAEILGISRRKLYNRLERYSLPEANGHLNGRSWRARRNGIS